MTSTPEDALELLRKARMDMTNAQAKLSDAMRIVASIPATADPNRKCPTCGIIARGPLSLAEHLHTSHGAPLPDHWQRAETLAGFTDEAPVA